MSDQPEQIPEDPESESQRPLNGERPFGDPNAEWDFWVDGALSDHRARLEERQQEPQPPVELEATSSGSPPSSWGLTLAGGLVVFVVLIGLIMPCFSVPCFSGGATLSAKERQADRERQIAEAMQLADETDPVR